MIHQVNHFISNLYTENIQPFAESVGFQTGKAKGVFFHYLSLVEKNISVELLIGATTVAAIGAGVVVWYKDRKEERITQELVLEPKGYLADSEIREELLDLLHSKYPLHKLLGRLWAQLFNADYEHDHAAHPDYAKQKAEEVVSLLNQIDSLPIYKELTVSQHFELA